MLDLPPFALRPLIALVALLLLCGGHAHAAACGDLLLEPGETCATCPADCQPATCTAAAAREQVQVSFEAPKQALVTAATVRLTYRSDLLRLPRDQGDAAVRKRLTAHQDPSVLSASDEGYALRIVTVRGPGFGPGALVDVEFDHCQGARLATAADLSCTVEGCAGSGGPLADCTCTISMLR